MSISMKDLHSSSDEEEKNLLAMPPVKKNIYSLSNSSHSTSKVKNDTEKKLVMNSPLPKDSPSIVKLIDTGQSNLENSATSETITVPKTNKETLKPNHEKTTWFKEQVSGSFKKISTHLSPSSSLETTMDSSFDERDDLGDPVKKLESVNTKGHWFKGQMNSYLSRSKHFYKRSASNTSINTLEELNADFNKIEQDCDDKYKQSNTQLSCSTMITEECYLPVLSSVSPRSHPDLTPNNSNKNQKVKDLKAQDMKAKDIKIKDAKEKKGNFKHTKATPSLSLSELLVSQKSTSSVPSTPNQVESPMFDEKKIFTGIINETDVDALAEIYVKEDLRDHLRASKSTPITFYQLMFGTLLLFPYLMLVYPAVIQGIFTGIILTYLYCCFTVMKLCPSAESVDAYRDDLKEYIRENINMLDEVVKSLPKPEVLQKPKDIKGWFQISDLYEDYSIVKINRKDVYVIIHENTLFIYMCKHNILDESSLKYTKRKFKKSMKNQVLSPDPAIIFEHECQFDLLKCNIYLKPADLPVRRMWNKKYPIKFTLPPGSYKKRDINFTLEELTMNLETILAGIDQSIYDSQEVILNDEENIFYLFANSGREKEDWFYRIQLSVSPLKHQVTLQDLRRERVSNLPSKSYPHYMVELITESERVIQRNEKGKKVEPYLAWLNVFIGRAFWDFWHDKYWTDKLHQKIQTRLSKINTPPFITDITLKELNPGHNIPIIHKGSLPVLDEYGVWSDLQITYKGYFTMTLETQLNVDYYSGLVSGILKDKMNKESTKMSDLDFSEDAEPHTDEHDGMFHDEISDVYLNAFDTVNDEEDDDGVMTDPRTKAFLESSAGKKVVGLVSWLAKSKLAKRVAETDFAKKAYGRAREKFRKMPIILKVEIQSLKGNLAVNLPPPPTNRLWFGFRGNPVIFITASPKVGDKQVRLTYLTSWIEKKLKEEFKKYLVLPAMQDLSIKLMDHQLSNLYPDRPTS